MKEVPVYTYLNQNTFGMVTEPFKPHIHAVVSTVGPGVVAAVLMKIGIIVGGLVVVLICAGVWAGFCEEIRRQETAAWLDGLSKNKK